MKHRSRSLAANAPRRRKTGVVVLEDCGVKT
jgi:hypothetical protein